MGFFNFKTVFYAIFLGFWFSTSLFAQENALSLPSKEYDLQMTKGTALLNQKKYPEAEAAFQAALAARPHDPKATYSLGVAAGKEGKYPEAERNLLESLRLDPQQTEVYLDLGVVYFQQKKFENALDILSRGENIDPEDPKILFYQGRIYQESREDDQAAPRFLRAAALANEDDPGLAAAAQYQAGVSFLRQRIFDDAKDAFTEVIRRSPHSEMGKSAQAFLIQIDQGGKEGEKWDLSVSVSDQYDDNVVLEPSDSAFVVSDKSDSRAVFYLNGNYYFRKPAPWGGGIGYSFYQSLHRELDSFDTQSHEPDLFLTYEKDRLQARVDYLFSFITVDRERYLQGHTVRPAATLAHGSGRLTRL
ncbi:MAG TPA: tetratricopeptide repeat protein, partial [Candidatus Manganitrophaceae bacterium]